MDCGLILSHPYINHVVWLSVGDTVASVSSLLEISKALKESAGPGTEYNEALEFLNVLTQTLSASFALRSFSLPSSKKYEPELSEQLNLIARPIRRFLDVLANSKPDIAGTTRRTAIFRSTATTALHFAVNKELKKLQIEIQLHLQVLSILNQQYTL
jgi:hypothetical protein